MRISALVTVLLVVAGCGSHLPPEPLRPDEAAQISAARDAIGSRRVTVSASDAETSARVVRVLRDHGFAADTSPADGAVRLDVAGPVRRTLEEPWLTIFSIFVIPVWTGDTGYEVTADGRAPSTCDTGGTISYGITALALTTLPRWRSWVLYMWGGELSSASDDRLAACAAQVLAEGLSRGAPDAR